MLLESYARKSTPVPLSDKLNSIFHASQDILLLCFVFYIKISFAAPVWYLFLYIIIYFSENKNLSRKSDQRVSLKRHIWMSGSAVSWFLFFNIPVLGNVCFLFSISLSWPPHENISSWPCQFETRQMNHNEFCPVAWIYLLNLFKVTCRFIKPDKSST